MNLNLIITLALFLAVFSTAKAGFVNLTESNFVSETSNQNVFMMFYAPWCPHCQRLKPTWNELADSNPSVKIGAVNCDVEHTICGTYKVNGYPTLFLQKDGQLYTYNGDRSLASLKDFIESGYVNASSQSIPVIASAPGSPNVPSAPAPNTEIQTNAEVQTNNQQPNSTENQAKGEVVVLTDKNFGQNTNNGQDWMVMFYAPWCPHCQRLKPIWKEFASVTRGRVDVGMVDCTVEKEVCGKFNVRGYPTVYFLKGSSMYEFNGDRTVNSLESFVQQDYKNQQPKPSPTFESKEDQDDIPFRADDEDFSPKGLAVSISTIAAVVLAVLLF